MKRVLTLCIIYNETHVLLGMKKVGFGQGRWNGFGGKVEEGESVELAAARELEEEAKIASSDMGKRGLLIFSFEGNPEILEVHVFSAQNYKGVPQETNEMRPQWFQIVDIPYNEMWPDDQHWLPLLLSGKNFEGEFHFRDNKTLLRHNLREIA
jgi:8-oxo-dGTP diphosphatase/2-hydroxy-dATP diphosphatase